MPDSIKEVLDNFAPDERVRELRIAMRKALKEATTGNHVDRAIRAAEVLQTALEDG